MKVNEDNALSKTFENLGSVYRIIKVIEIITDEYKSIEPHSSINGGIYIIRKKGCMAESSIAIFENFDKEALNKAINYLNKILEE